MVVVVCHIMTDSVKAVSLILLCMLSHVFDADVVVYFLAYSVGVDVGVITKIPFYFLSFFFISHG